MEGELLSESAKRYLTEKIFKFEGWLFNESGFRFSFHEKHPHLPLALDYVDLRAILRQPIMRSFIAGAFLPLLEELKPDFLVDLPLSCSPLVTTLSDMTKIPMVTIRHEALQGGSKKYGIGRATLGEHKSGGTALIIDDILSALARTKFEAIRILSDEKLKPSIALCVVVDREEGGREVLEREGFVVYNLLSLSSMRRLYLANGFVTKERYDKLEEASRALKEAALEIARCEQLRNKINLFIRKWGLFCEVPDGLKSVGVGGDCRTYTSVVFLRGPFPGYDALVDICSEITGKFDINRVLFDTGKQK